MAYFKDPISIGALLDKSLNRAVGPKTAQGLDEIQVIKSWRTILGPVMSKYSVDESFVNGALTVRIRSSILRNDLFLKREDLIDKINNSLKRKIVYALIFR